MSTVEVASRIVVMGIGASFLIDAWAWFVRRAFGVAGLDYRLLGRWIGHFRRGQFFHRPIGRANVVAGERAIGLAAHYAIGIGFALAFVVLAGRDWLEEPAIIPAMAFGIATVAAPWFVMQPAFGAGIAASRTPRPWASRVRNLATHTVYGLGLFLVALGLAAV